ncbi:hypothetical protein MMC29_001441 [Sticta canariensis]|nr:hypothetical protein [Sticta canariensis]
MRLRNRYEVLHRGQEDKLSERSHAASNFVKSTARLPARVLPGHRHKPHFRFGVAMLVTGVTLTTFSLIIHNISNWIPSSEGWGILGISGKSCDLISANNTKMEKAFTINLRSPIQLSFAEAKGIDVAWDLFVGQGGRLLLASISYIVFMDGLTRLLETSAVSYQLYATIVFDNSSLQSTWTSLKAIFTGHSWRGRAFLAWFFVASIYVLAFPALVSAATGYLSPSTSGILMPDQSVIPSTSRDIVYCISIANGANTLIGLNESLVFGPSTQDLVRGEPSESYIFHGSDFSSFMTMWNYSYYPHHVFGSPLNSTNVTGYSSNESYLNVLFTTNITLHGNFYKFNNYDPEVSWDLRYCYNKHLLPLDLSKLAYCLPESYFVWGFSSLLLYIICSLQITWTVGMFIVWLDANINSQLCRSGRKTRGFLRPALDIAEAVRDVLGEELCTYQSEEISRTLDTMRMGVQYYAADADGDGVSHIGLGSNRSRRLLLSNDTTYGGSRASREAS